MNAIGMSNCKERAQIYLGRDQLGRSIKFRLDCTCLHSIQQGINAV